MPFACCYVDVTGSGLLLPSSCARRGRVVWWAACGLNALGRLHIGIDCCLLFRLCLLCAALAGVAVASVGPRCVSAVSLLLSARVMHLRRLPCAPRSPAVALAVPAWTAQSFSLLGATFQVALVNLQFTTPGCDPVCGSSALCTASSVILCMARQCSKVSSVIVRVLEGRRVGGPHRESEEGGHFNANLTRLTSVPNLTASAAYRATAVLAL